MLLAVVGCDADSAVRNMVIFSVAALTLWTRMSALSGGGLVLAGLDKTGFVCEHDCVNAVA